MAEIVACLDANVLISAMLAPSSLAPPSAIVERFLSSRFNLVVAETTLEEITDKIRSKPYLAQRMKMEELAAFIFRVRELGVVIPVDVATVARLTRDPRDDYLLAPAIQARVDYVVSGDKDLLVLGEVEGVKIVSPAEFLRLLDTDTGSPRK